MAQADWGATGVPVLPKPPAPVPVPNAGAATGPTSPLIPPDVGKLPATPFDIGKSPTMEQMRQTILTSPEYLGAAEQFDAGVDIAKQKRALDEEWATKAYNLSKAQIAGSMPSYGAGLAEAAAADALQKEKAAHDYANQQEYVREALGSRGLASSGQVGVDQGELTFNYNTLLKQIDLAAAVRKAQAAQAQANAQKNIQQQLAALDFNRQKDLAYASIDQKEFEQGIASNRYEYLSKVVDRLMSYNFDPRTNEYKGPRGEVLTIEQASQIIAPGATAPNFFAPLAASPELQAMYARSGSQEF